MQAIYNVQALHSFRAHLVPVAVNPSGAERLADAGAPPTIRLKAVSASQALERARIVTGMQVLRVERVQG